MDGLDRVDGRRREVWGVDRPSLQLWLPIGGGTHVQTRA